jgi:hypothetical protein
MMAYKRLYHEILEEFEEAKTRQEKIDVLKKHSDHWFVTFLNYAFNPDVKFDFDTVPNYKPAVEPAGLTWSTLHLEMRKLYLFMPSSSKYVGKLPERKHTNLLLEILESVHAEEAKLLEQVFLKKLKVKGLTDKIVKEAFPDLPFEPKP